MRRKMTDVEDMNNLGFDFVCSECVEELDKDKFRVLYDVREL